MSIIYSDEVKRKKLFACQIKASDDDDADDNDDILIKIFHVNFQQINT